MHTSEYSLIQNPALGAICQWSFAKEFWNQTARKQASPVAYMMVVLPICFNREATDAIHSRRLEGGLLNAIADDRSVVIGLQERMEEMFEQTFEAMLLGCASGLLELNTTDFVVFPKRKTQPDFAMSPIHTRMLATSRRLGLWFARLPLEQICNYLMIRL